MWLVEHLCHHPRYMNHGLTRLNCTEEYGTSISGYELPEGIEAWFTHICSLNTNQIKWTFSCLSVNEVMYMSADVCFQVLMGLRSVCLMPHIGFCASWEGIRRSPIMKIWVHRLWSYAQELLFLKKRIWHKCRFLEPHTQVRDLSWGEVESSYATWYGKRVWVNQEPERPAKRSHVQHFIDWAKEQWA